MKKLMMPAAIALVGLGAGVGVGYALKPTPDPMTAYAAEAAEAGDGETPAAIAHSGGHKGDVAYVPLEKPLFVPLATSLGRASLVRLEIHLEVEQDFAETAEHHEPKLRDAFLRTLLSHVEEGAFAADGTPEDFVDLRSELLADAQRILGREVHNVLIAELLHHSS